MALIINVPNIIPYTSRDNMLGSVFQHLWDVYDIRNEVLDLYTKFSWYPPFIHKERATTLDKFILVTYYKRRIALCR